MDTDACSCEHLIQQSKWQELQKWCLRLSGTTCLPCWYVEQHLAACFCAVWLPCCFGYLEIFVETLHLAQLMALLCCYCDYH